MKNFSLFLFAALFSIVSGQDYVPMLEDNMLWCVEVTAYNFETSELEYNNHQFRLTENIMVFNEKEYRTVIKRMQFSTESTPPGDWSNWFTVFHLAEDIMEKKVYIYYSEDDYTNHLPGEFVLYDFSLEPGEEIPGDGYDIMVGDAFVTEITYEDVFDRQNVKTWNIHFEDDDWNEMDFKIYEGIGASSGLNFLDIFYDIFIELTCHREAMAVKDMVQPEIKVYPNPFTNHISLENNHLIKQLQLFDLSGRQIINKRSLEDLNHELGELNPGNYILRVTKENNRVESFKLIKK